MSKCSEQELQKAISDEESVRGQLQAELAANKRHCRKLLSEARAAQYSGLLAELKQVSQSSTLTPNPLMYLSQKELPARLPAPFFNKKHEIK